MAYTNGVNLNVINLMEIIFIGNNRIKVYFYYWIYILHVTSLFI